MIIDKSNVGRIAERIAMNELEARGFHIIDLAYTSKTFANVDFIASKGGQSFNVQVKGSSVYAGDRRAVHYGFCTEGHISNDAPMFNGKTAAALRADVVVLMGVRSPTDYWAVVLPVERAEEAAQLNLSAYYRLPKANGDSRKPGKVWIELDRSSAARKAETAEKVRERELLLAHLDAWDLAGPPGSDQLDKAA